MSGTDEVVAKATPEAVELKTLGATGEFIRGSGLQKKELGESGVRAMHYGEIHTHYGTFTEATRSFVEVAHAAKLRMARSGDLVIATTSEDDEAVAKAVAWVGEGDVAVSSDAYIYRHELDPLYVAYFFQSDSFHRQKRRLITGTKVRRISGEALAKIVIPVPPRAVQIEVATVLERMERCTSSLGYELGLELRARGQQYEYYRDSLLALADDTRVRWTRIGELGSLYGGLTGKTKADFSDGNARFVSYNNVYKNPETNTVPDDFVAIAPGERQNQVRWGDILFTASSETAEEVGMSSAVTTEPAEPLYLNSFCFGFRPHDVSELRPGFAKHLMRSAGVRHQVIRAGNGVTRINISKARFCEVAIPVPSISEQDRLASLLDRFEAHVNDLASELVSELNARGLQYQHYRDRLFTFPEAA